MSHLRNKGFIIRSSAVIINGISSHGDRGPMMERKFEKNNLWWLGGALVVGAAFLGLRRLMDFDVDFDPWDDAYLY
jgi:hypothetical protein